MCWKTHQKGSLISSLLIDGGQEASKMTDQEGKENTNEQRGPLTKNKPVFLVWFFLPSQNASYLKVHLFLLKSKEVKSVKSMKQYMSAILSKLGWKRVTGPGSSSRSSWQGGYLHLDLTVVRQSNTVKCWLSERRPKARAEHSSQDISATLYEKMGQMQQYVSGKKNLLVPFGLHKR